MGDPPVERKSGADHLVEGAVVVGKAYDFLLWLLPKVEKFPRSYRFSVGERMTEAGLDLLVSVTEAAYSRDKADLLRSASRKVNVVRLLLCLARDLRVLPEAPYRFATEQLDEIGRILGGWLKSLRPDIRNDDNDFRCSREAGLGAFRPREPARAEQPFDRRLSPAGTGRRGRSRTGSAGG